MMLMHNGLTHFTIPLEMQQQTIKTTRDPIFKRIMQWNAMAQKQDSVSNTTYYSKQCQCT
jgi:hypothetical protein